MRFYLLEFVHLLVPARELVGNCAGHLFHSEDEIDCAGMLTRELDRQRLEQRQPQPEPGLRLTGRLQSAALALRLPRVYQPPVQAVHLLLVYSLHPEAQR